MRLLDRYLLRELLLPLGYCVGGFWVFWMSFDLVSEMENFQRHQLQAWDIAEYYLVRTPELLVVILPMALLLALLYTLTSHARHHELVAMRAAGLSLWRLGTPYFAVGLLFSLLLFYLNECWVPDSTDRAEQILNQYQPKPSEGTWHPLNFKNDRQNRMWTIAAYNPDTHVMLKPQVEWTLADGSRRHIIADRADRLPEGWQFSNVVFLEFSAEPDAIPVPVTTNLLVMTEFAETPELIKSEIKVSRLSNLRALKKPQLSLAEIRNYLRLHRQLSPDNYALLNTQLHGRLAEPWTCLVVVLVALPFGAASGRRNIFVGVANSIFIAFAYFILLRLGMALGTGGYLTPWLAAWLPNGLFGGLGLWLTQKIR